MLETNITKSTFQFLNSLKKNNNREWFSEHKTDFTTESEKVKCFFNNILEKLKSHDEIERLKVFRIYRDVRFSKNKTPYKNNFSASFARAGNHRRGGVLSLGFVGFRTIGGLENITNDPRPRRSASTNDEVTSAMPIPF